MLSGTIFPCDSRIPIFLPISSLFISIIAAMTIAMTDRNIPIPIRCITLIPRVMGIKTLSYNGIRIITDNVIALCSVAGGIFKMLPIFLFIAMPCFVKKVVGC
ncbi:hypothetical protein CFOL_v3_24290 [Cephalotus follicularis]|uniref:Uncharacterized protein n=1 Tax=Cephalotus follicularis TaxID=3775 RepID=A0A1Q3CKQ5_CEPFO|nr:hypothetical protein CFOL_v3_24290 [Cephalotus follicularis]